MKASRDLCETWTTTATRRCVDLLSDSTPNLASSGCWSFRLASAATYGPISRYMKVFCLTGIKQDDIAVSLFSHNVKVSLLERFSGSFTGRGWRIVWEQWAQVTSPSSVWISHLMLTRFHAPLTRQGIDIGMLQPLLACAATPVRSSGNASGQNVLLMCSSSRAADGWAVLRHTWVHMVWLVPL